MEFGLGAGQAPTWSPGVSPGGRRLFLSGRERVGYSGETSEVPGSYGRVFRFNDENRQITNLGLSH